MNMQAVAGIEAVVLIFGMVEFLKKFSLRGRALTLASFAVGALVATVYSLPGLLPASAPYVELAVKVAFWGMAASGVYDFINKRWPGFQEPQG